MKICITGKVGSGKTTAIEYLSGLGYATYIADEYVHSIYKVGAIGYKKIAKAFGKEYVNEVEVDRKKLGKLVFSNSIALEKLNKLLCPLIKKWIKRIKDIDQPIFIELGIYLNHVEYFKKCFDKVVVVIGQESIQEKKMQSLQWTDEQKTLENPVKSVSDSNFITIDNSKTIDDFYKNIDQKLLKNL